MKPSRILAPVGWLVVMMVQRFIRSEPRTLGGGRVPGRAALQPARHRGFVPTVLLTELPCQVSFLSGHHAIPDDDHGEDGHAEQPGAVDPHGDSELNERRV